VIQPAAEPITTYFIFVPVIFLTAKNDLPWGTLPPRSTAPAEN